MWQYHLIKLISKFVCLFPYQLVLGVGRGAGVLYYYLVKKQVNRARNAMREGLRLPAEEIERILLAMCKNLGMNFMELLYMPNLSRENIGQFSQIDHPEYIQLAIDQKCGVVSLAAHIGNWEWLGATLAMNGYPLTSMIKRQPNEQHTKLLTEYRSMVGIETFASGTGEILSAVKAMKKHKMLGFIADQDAGPEGIFVPFLGKLASTPTGPAFFSKKFKAPILPLFIIRLPNYKHQVIVHEPIYYEDTGDEKQDMRRVTERMVKITEDMIRKYPEQWLWIQKRWNTPYDKRNKIYD